MDQSTPRKALDCIVSLLTSPSDIPAYLRTLPLWGRQPVDHQLPWYSFGAIHWLERHLRTEHRVFEFGGGGSTLFYARRATSVTVAESHPEWAAKLKAATRDLALGNVKVALHPLGDNDAGAFTQHPFFNCIEQGAPWDVISVDCFCGFGTGGRGGALRPHALSLARRHLAPGGCIILDDSWMYPEELQPRPGWNVTDFVGVGPCRYGVTSTAIITPTTNQPSH